MAEQGHRTVIAAGNAGPSSLTVGSPGSAAERPDRRRGEPRPQRANLERLQFGPAVGALYRPFLGTQTAYFSSRGPDADGRLDPDVSRTASRASARAPEPRTRSRSGAERASPRRAWRASPRSFARGFPRRRPGRSATRSSPRRTRRSCRRLRRPRRGARVRGRGSRRSLLLAGSVPDTLPSQGNLNTSVKVNVEKGTDLNVRDGVRQETAPAFGRASGTTSSTASTPTRSRSSSP